MIFFITFILAACNICYELALAQVSAVVLGSTDVRYAVTIGVYLAAMGFGTFLFRSKEEHLARDFVRFELGIVGLGLIGPYLILLGDWAGKSLFLEHTGLVELINNFMVYSLIVAIGIISGVEIPLLIALGKKIENQNEFKILSIDYFGTLCGTLIFPIVLMPNFGVFQGINFLSLFNILSVGMMLIWSWYKSGKPIPPKYVGGLLVALSVAVLLTWNGVEVQNFFSTRLFQ